jgi:hypothetical protein
MKYNEYFTSKQMPNTEKYFILLVEESPIELKDFIRDLHLNHFEDCLPNDWIYAVACEAFDLLESNTWKKGEFEVEADCYNNDLLRWVREPFAHGFCNQVLSENQVKDFFDLLSQAQYLAKYEIYSAVQGFLEEHAGE